MVCDLNSVALVLIVVGLVVSVCGFLWVVCLRFRVGICCWFSDLWGCGC